MRQSIPVIAARERLDTSSPGILCPLHPQFVRVILGILLCSVAWVALFCPAVLYELVLHASERNRRKLSSASVTKSRTISFSLFSQFFIHIVLIQALRAESEQPGRQSARMASDVGGRDTPASTLPPSLPGSFKGDIAPASPRRADLARLTSADLHIASPPQTPPPPLPPHAARSNSLRMLASPVSSLRGSSISESIPPTIVAEGSAAEHKLHTPPRRLPPTPPGSARPPHSRAPISEETRSSALSVSSPRTSSVAAPATVPDKAQQSHLVESRQTDASKERNVPAHVSTLTRPKTLRLALHSRLKAIADFNMPVYGWDKTMKVRQQPPHPRANDIHAM